MATIYRLTIDPVALGITKPIDKVYIKNLYVDTDDTHIRTAPFEYGANIIGDISFVELPPTTLGSIYQIQLFGSEGMALSVFFGMPKRNTKLSELDIFTAYPPRSYYPEASVAWGQLSGAIANQVDLVDVMFTKSSASAMQAAIDSKNSLQDTAISENLTAIGANKSAINLKVDGIKTSTDAAIALRAKTSDVNAKNALQDSAITALQDKNVSQDAAIELRAITTEVGAALDLKANTSDVNSKNTLQDNAITAAQNKADAAIPKSEKGAANGVATLDADGKISPLQIPTEQPIAWGNITGSIADQTDLGTAATKEVGVGVGQIPLVENIPELAKTTLTYTTTTVELPNLAVDSEGTLKRSTTLLGTAATKNVGAGNGQIPLAQDVGKAFVSTLNWEKSSPDLNTVGTSTYGTTYYTYNPSNRPPSEAGFDNSWWSVWVEPNHNTSNSYRQFAKAYANNDIWTRVYINGAFTSWTPVGQTKQTYLQTTAAGANVVVDSTGKLMRSTSSERYKDILAPLELDDARYADAMALKPIIYRSTADADNPAYHFYSFSAEELGTYDPAFTLWRETETVTDEDGNVTEQQPLAERQAEGININALLAMSHAIAIKQDAMIKALEARIEALESK